MIKPQSPTLSIIGSRYVPLLFILIAFIYNIIVHRSKIAVSIMVFVIFYLMYLYDFFGKLDDADFKNKMERKELLIEDLTENNIKVHNGDSFFIDNLDIYPVNQKPNKFIFLHQNSFFKSIIYDLRFIKRYDHADYFKLIILIEHFLKMYYGIIIGRYEYRTIDNLESIRKEILNNMYNFIVDAPQYTRNGMRLDKKIHDAIIKTQAYTYKKLKNISKKYPSYNPKNPHPITPDDIIDNYNIIV